MLDRDKPFGQCGANIYGWKYFQDGKYFNFEGKEIDQDGKLVKEEIKQEEPQVKAGEAPSEPSKPKRVGRPRAGKKTS